MAELVEIHKKSEKRSERIENAITQLAEAKKRTELSSLVEAIKNGFNALEDQISTLSSRWEIYAETTFRSTIKALLSKRKGVQVKSGYYGDREVDIIICDSEHIILEITSRTKSADLDRLIRSGKDYERREGVKPTLMLATSYISPKLMAKVLSLPEKIEVFSYEGEEEQE